MAIKFDSLNRDLREFIEKQHMFFVGTASDGLVNVSPKGMDTLKIVSDSRVVWLNYTGSGNETAAHVSENPRMTIMFCSFDKKPLILKLFGTAKSIYPKDEQWREMLSYFDSSEGARQIFELNMDFALSSCGYGVARYEYLGERDTLAKWLHNKGEDGIREYWRENNSISLDGKEIRIDAE